MKPSGELFLEQTQSRRFGVGGQERNKAATRQGGASQGGGRARHPCGPLVAQPTYLLHLYILPYPENIEEHHENLIPPPQPSVSVISHLGAFAGAPLEGESTMEGLYIISKDSLMSCEYFTTDLRVHSY